MRSRATLATLAVGALATTGLFGHATTAARTPAEPARPNILLITTDDLAVGDLAYMPHVRSLIAERGVTFADGLAPTPLCVPARASLLTGQYAHHHGARTISGPHGGYAAFDDRATIATALQEAGYQTLFAGKYLNGYGRDGTAMSVPPGWTHWRATVDPSTYRFLDPKMNIDGTLRREQGYTTDVMTRESDAMIRAAARTKRPWFEWLNYVAPHVGGPAGQDDPVHRLAGTDAAFKVTVPARRDRDRLRGVRLPSKPTMFLDDTAGHPEGSPRHKRFSPLQKEALQQVYQRRLEAALGLDRAVAHELRMLRRTRQLDRTLVVFTSDNGYAVGENNINGKLWHYDDIVSIPVLMRGPGIPAGTTTRTPITNPDIAVTILAAAGAVPPGQLDGVDLLPWLRRPAQLRVVPLEGWKVNDGSKRLYWGVRAGSWTYVRMRGGDELFDRSRDPYELHNLATAEHQATSAADRHALALLKSLAVRFRSCAGASCPQAFYPLTSADQLPPQDAA